MNPAENDWIPLLVLLAAAPLWWVFVLSVIARISGWTRLAETYPYSGASSHGTSSPRFAWKSARLRLGISYNNCLTYEIRPDGLAIAPISLCRPGHPPLLIPWSEFRDARRVRGVIGFPEIEFGLERAPGIRIGISPRLHEDLVRAGGRLPAVA